MEKIPSVIVNPEEYRQVMAKLDKIEEKLEFTRSEIYQRYGKQIGREIGILYGVTAALVIILAYLLLLISPAIPNMQSYLEAVIRELLK